VVDPDVPAGGADVQSERGLLFRRVPLASGTTATTVAIVAGIALLFRHTPLPDLPPGDTSKHLAAIVAGSTTSQDGVHVTIPQGWKFARYAHSPQVVSRITVPGLGQVPVGPSRRVMFAAQRSPGTCVVILERDKIQNMNLDEDAATLRQTVDQNVYERNIFNWVTNGYEDRFKLLVNAADEILNQPGPSRRMIAFTRAKEQSAQLSRQPARQLLLTTNSNGREKGVLSYIVAHKNQWQYALIEIVGEPPRLCGLEIAWIRVQLSFE
jgi:hypothetical protein